jgi:hypothetical protein
MTNPASKQAHPAEIEVLNTLANLACEEYLAELAKTGQGMTEKERYDYRRGFEHGWKRAADYSSLWLGRAKGEALEAAAKLAETWGNAPPNPYGRRAALAAAIRLLKVNP